MEALNLMENVFLFDTKEEAKDFVDKVIRHARLYLYISLADMHRIKNGKYQIDPDGYDFMVGYNKSDVKYVKPEKYGNKWMVKYPVCGRIVMKENGTWHAEKLRDGDESGGAED